MSGRFKPKPTSRKPSAVPTASTSKAGDAPSQPADDDDFFMRKRTLEFHDSKGRLLRQDLNEANSSTASKEKSNASKATVVLINSSSDGDQYTDEDSPKRKKKSKKRARSTRTASPSKRIRSDEEPDVASDEDVLDVGYTKKAAEKAKPKRGPRALTPPEKLPEYVLRESHRVLDHRPHSFNPMHMYGQDLDYTQDEDYAQAIQDSELQTFAESIARPEGSSRPTRSPSHHDEDSIRVNITIQMVAHADPKKYTATTETLKKAMAIWETPMQVDCGLRESFQSVFNEVSSQKNVYSGDLVLTYNNMHVWSTATPESLRIYSSATFKGYKQAIWDQVKARRERREASPPPQAAASALNNQEASFPPPPAAAESTPTAPKDLVSLKVRSKDLETLSLAVPKETLLRAVLKHYLKQVGKLNAGWEEKCRLEFDDEPLDLKTKLSATELEEDDLVEVIIAD